MPIGDPGEGFFYPTLTLMIDSYKIDSLSDTLIALCRCVEFVMTVGMIC